MRTRTLAFLLVLLQLPLLPSVAAADASATGPDADGAWLLAFDVPATGPVAAALAVLREDVDGPAWGAREIGTISFAAPTRYEVSFLPAEGPGRYTVALTFDEGEVDAVSFDVADAGAQRTAEFDVPDAPTYLDLTSDDVNADGKTKSPGDAVITRATLSDGNGLAELDGVVYVVERAGATVESGPVGINASASATSAALELRYDRAPLAAGEHTMRLRAVKDGAIVAEASRTFVIRDVAPTFVSASLPDATPDENLTLDGAIVLADKNGAVGPGAIELRVYRGNTRVEGAGFAATLGAPARLADVNGSARWSYPLALAVPTRATPGAHRVSAYVNDTLLGSAAFDVEALPVLRGVETSANGTQLRLTIDASGAGLLAARLTDGDGSTTSVTAAISPTNTTEVTLEAPRRGVPLAWTVALRARADGPVLAERNGTWTPAATGPQLSVAALHARGRLPASWTLAAPGWDVAQADATVSFTRWDGAPAPSIVAALDGARLRAHAPTSLEAGRYTGHVSLSWPNGTFAEASWTFDAGPWVQLALGEPVVSGRNATLAVENVGGLAISRVVVESQPAAPLSLRVDNATLAPTASNGRSHFSGMTLAPGQSAELRVALPDGPLPSGRYAVAVRVLAKVEIG